MLDKNEKFLHHMIVSSSAYNLCGSTPKHFPWLAPKGSFTNRTMSKPGVGRGGNFRVLVMFSFNVLIKAAGI